MAGCQNASHREGHQNRLQVGQDIPQKDDETDRQCADHDDRDSREGTPESAALEVGWEEAGHRWLG